MWETKGPQGPQGKQGFVGTTDTEGKLVKIEKDPTGTEPFSDLAVDIGNTGGGQEVNNMQPFTAVNYIIALQGVFPSHNRRDLASKNEDGIEEDDQAHRHLGTDPFIGKIIMFGSNFAPRGWAFCDGSLLPIAQNSALFSIMGTTYGGDGCTTFGLPDLRGRAPMHPGNGPDLTSWRLGEKGGTETNTLTVNQLAPHNHNTVNSFTNVAGIVLVATTTTTTSIPSDDDTFKACKD